MLLELDRNAPGALHEQLERGLRNLVRSGRLAPSARMPSSRTLATQLGVSRGVVLEAYSQLVAEGYLTASQGAPTRVAQAPSTEPPPAPASSFHPRYRYDFDPGLPDLTSFPRDEWARSVRAVLKAAPFAALGHGDPRGVPELRNELMAYLGRVRGAAPEPEHTLVTAGFTQGFALLCRVLAGRGIEQVAIEDPGYQQHRLVAEAAGLMPVPVGVDDHGLKVEELAETQCEVVVVTPSHQYPTGAVLSPERRTALLEWADEGDALVIEDDYDSELRYDREPVGALQGLAPERVCQIGSLSTRLAPALRLGWMLSPSWLTGALTYEKGVSDGGSPAIPQLALADFIARGELDRHLRRMRLQYRAKHATLVGALRNYLPDARLSGIAAGLYALAQLGEGTDEATVLGAAARAGIGIEGIGGGLVIGFASLSDQAIEQGVALLELCIP